MFLVLISSDSVLVWSSQCCQMVLIDMQVDSQMKLLQNSWSELLMLNVLYLQMCHDRTDAVLLVSISS